ncbi:putative bacteriophage Baseplate protein [Magnetospirillum sp. XM-1]|uniref:phage baseplate assembly protein n=1 Tax=Magnetospirillum sp. XM-1 TaxID=1663591 RepID=UPI00073DFCFA|nr:hypothetical protein [Magnetospirillum sp. XM-1]CUW41146.1 putative bacteriophage Baseplate protein [Magnetospirillum sp. XM-1]
MARTGERVTLQVGDKLFGGWKSVSIRMSLEKVAGSFDVTASESWTKGGQLVTAPLRAGDGVVAMVDGETVVTGYIDAAEPFYSTSDAGTKVRGRDRTADLVDCSADETELLGQKLPRIAADLCKPFGIPVRVVGWDGGPAFAKYAVDPGETVARAIEDACRQVGAMMWTDGLGTLLLGRPVGGAYAGTLRLGEHIIEASGGDDHTNRFSEYHVTAGKDSDSGVWDQGGHLVEAEARDGEIRRYRPLTLSVEAELPGAATAAQRAAWEARVRRARGLKRSLKVQSWRSPTGLIWRPGLTLDIDDRRLGGGRLMVSEVGLDRSKQGTFASLQVVPEGAFEPLAEGQKADKAKGGDAWK